MLKPHRDFSKTGRITKNFKSSEFACKGRNCCGGASPINFELVERLQLLRDKAGRPLRINSGFRCPIHNKAVGGASKSLHMLGLAADVQLPSKMTMNRFLELAEEVGFGKIIKYSWGLHLDMRTW